MASSDTWRIVVILFAICILIGGAGAFVAAYAGVVPYPTDFADIIRYVSIGEAVIGGLYAATGICGIFAGAFKKKFLAALYFFGVLLITIIIALAFIIIIAVAKSFITADVVCQGVSNCPQVINDVVSLFSIIFGVILGINVCFCGMYTICAGVYWRSLVTED